MTEIKCKSIAWERGRRGGERGREGVELHILSYISIPQHTKNNNMIGFCVSCLVARRPTSPLFLHALLTSAPSDPPRPDPPSK